MKVHCETTEISPAVVQFSRLLAIFCGFEFSPCFWNDSRRRFPRQNPWSNYGGFELSDWYISKKKAGEDFGIVLECLGFGWRLDRVSPLRKRRGSGDSPGLQNRRLAPCGVNGAFDSHTLPPISFVPSVPSDPAPPRSRFRRRVPTLASSPRKRGSSLPLRTGSKRRKQIAGAITYAPFQHFGLNGAFFSAESQSGDNQRVAARR